MGNPQVVYFIGDYLSREAQQLEGKDLYTLHAKFILEYST
jgi:hypothetical protein